MVKVENVSNLKSWQEINYNAAHASSVWKDGVNAANFGIASMFSFHATKVFNRTSLLYSTAMNITGIRFIPCLESRELSPGNMSTL